jgi:hypothetical protein
MSPAQEFAERVEAKWGFLLGAKPGEYPKLISIIVEELRAGRWAPDTAVTEEDVQWARDELLKL